MLALRGFLSGWFMACCAVLTSTAALWLCAAPRAASPAVIVQQAAAPPAAASCAAPPAVHVVDAVRGLGARALVTSLRLAPGEWIAAINDRAAVGDPVEALTGADDGAERVLDLMVASARGARRVLVVLH